MASTSGTSPGSTPKEDRTCKECGKVFTSPSHLQVHLSSLLGHSTGNGPYHCPICTMPCKTPGGVGAHMKKVHRKTLREYKSEETAQGTSGQESWQKTDDRTPKRRKVKINDDERAFMIDRVELEEGNIKETTEQLEKLPKKKVGVKAEELEKLEGDLEFSTQLFMHYKDVLSQ